MKSIILTIGAFVCSYSYACLNEYDIKMDGTSTELWETLPIFYQSFDTEFSQKFVDYYDLSNRDSIPFEELSDVAVHLSHLHQFEKSLELLLWLYERYPDEYRINANLGTLYELNGNIDSAYYFIERSIQLNPDSHEGTEWVHLAILKTKKKLNLSPDWLNQHRVFGIVIDPLDSDAIETSKEEADYNDSIYSSKMDTIWDIAYQMAERIPFTPTPDPVLASIFDELGELLAVYYSVSQAYVAYSICGEYDSENKYATKTKLNELANILKHEKIKLPDYREYFPTEDKYYKIKPEKLPGYSSPEEETTLSDKDPKESSNFGNYALWITLGGILVLIIVLVFVFYKRRNH